MIRMITSDMDGTLLKGDDWGTRRLPDDFGEVLSELEKRGVRFLAASGRTYPSVRMDFGEYADRIDYICDNGGCLVENGKVVHINEVPRETVDKLIDLIHTRYPQEDIHLSICTARGTYKDFDEKWPGAERERHCTFLEPDLHKVNEPVTKFVMAGEFDAFAIKAELDPIMGDELNFITSGDHFLDIMKKDVDKGSGIRFFRERWGLTKEECMSFGDEYNDLGQFSESYYSFAMGNAREEVKAYARFIADTNEHDGVTKAIWEYALK